LVIPSDDERCTRPERAILTGASIDATMSGWLTLPGDGFAHARNIHLAGYEFEVGKAAIS
jgi:hypothetical protein